MLWQAAGLNISRSDSLAGIKRKLERNAELFFVAEGEGKIVGVVMGSYDGRRGWVNHLAVSPGRQRSGLGTGLMRELERRLKARGCVKVNLHIEPANGRFQGFYQRLGYGRHELIYMTRWLDE